MCSDIAATWPKAGRSHVDPVFVPFILLRFLFCPGSVILGTCLRTRLQTRLCPIHLSIADQTSMLGPGILPSASVQVVRAYVHSLGPSCSKGPGVLVLHRPQRLARGRSLSGQVAFLFPSSPCLTFSPPSSSVPLERSNFLFLEESSEQ